MSEFFSAASKKTGDKKNRVSLVLVCAGKGKRAGFAANKLLEKLNGKTVAEIAFDRFLSSGYIDEFIVVVSESDYEIFDKIFNKKATVVIGGNARGESVLSGVKAASGDIVLIHDGARPFVTEKVIKNCLDSVYLHRSGIAAVRSVNTVSIAEGRALVKTVGKDDVYEIQTPQGFYKEDIIKAFSLAKADGLSFPDESSLYLKYIGKPFISEGDIGNVKLTVKDDFTKAKRQISGEAEESVNRAFPPLPEMLPEINLNGTATVNYKDLRTGTGFDCHKLVPGRKFVLGGITIPHEKGLLGHSDADVLTHAIMDALLSAAGLRDIGYYFPDSDDKYLGISSVLLLEQVMGMLEETGFAVHSLSATIMAEKPKLKDFIPIIKQNLCDVLEIPTGNFGLGATTLEGLGFVGREEGVCVYASAVIVKK